MHLSKNSHVDGLPLPPPPALGVKSAGQVTTKKQNKKNQRSNDFRSRPHLAIGMQEVAIVPASGNILPQLLFRQSTAFFSQIFCPWSCILGDQ